LRSTPRTRARGYKRSYRSECHQSQMNSGTPGTGEVKESADKKKYPEEDSFTNWKPSKKTKKKPKKKKRNLNKLIDTTRANYNGRHDVGRGFEG